MHPTRRFTLLAPLIAAGLGLSACASMNPENVAKAEKALKRAARYSKSIATGLKNVSAQLAALKLPGMTPEIWTVVNTSIDGVIKVSTDIDGVTTIAQAQPLVQKLSTYVQTVVNSLATLPLPDSVLTGLRAAAILVPFIETTVDLAMTNSEMSRADEAERILLALAN